MYNHSCVLFPPADMRWVKVPATGDIPGGRASHSSAVFKDHLYIFGGIGPEGTLNTTYKYHTGREASPSCRTINATQLENALAPCSQASPLGIHYRYPAVTLRTSPMRGGCPTVLSKAVNLHLKMCIVFLHCREAALDTPRV